MESENKTTPKSNKRVTPGRTAKNNKRKASVDSAEGNTRTVKPKLTTPERVEKRKMSTPLTLEVLRQELEATKKDQIDHIDRKLLEMNGNIAANSQAINDEDKS